MSRALKHILFAIGGAVGLLVLGALAVLLFVDVNRYKPWLEEAASNALGMDVRAGGRLGTAFSPRFHLMVEDGHIRSEQGVSVVSSKSANPWIEPLPLLRKKFRLRRLELTQPRFSIERDPEGGPNVESLKMAAALLGALDGASVSLSDGTLLCADRRSGEGFEATDFDTLP